MTPQTRLLLIIYRALELYLSLYPKERAKVQALNLKLGHAKRRKKK